MYIHVDKLIRLSTKYLWSETLYCVLYLLIQLFFNQNKTNLKSNVKK